MDQHTFVCEYFRATHHVRMYKYSLRMLLVAMVNNNTGSIKQHQQCRTFRSMELTKVHGLTLLPQKPCYSLCTSVSHSCMQQLSFARTKSILIEWSHTFPRHSRMTLKGEYCSVWEHNLLLPLAPNATPPPTLCYSSSKIWLLSNIQQMFLSSDLECSRRTDNPILWLSHKRKSIQVW